MKVIDTKWYGWIPTNRGKLNFGFISLHKEIIKFNKKVKEVRSSNYIEYSNLDISYLSDSHSFRFLNFFTKEKEIPGKANIIFRNEINEIHGNVEILYCDFGKIKSSFKCKYNGVIEFDNIYYDLENFNIHPKELKSLLYVLIKTIIHGDAQHHQKIDVALKITEKKFIPNEISSSLLEYIKLVERNVKKSTACESLLRNENLIYEIDGYLSYFKSFSLLFNEKKIIEDYEFAECVVKSLKSTISKRMHKNAFKSSIQTAFITFLGVFISINILLNSFWLQDKNDLVLILSQHVRSYYFWGSFLFVGILFSEFTNCKIKAYLYKYYIIYENIKLLQNANFFKLNWIGKLIKLVPLYIFIIFIIFFGKTIIDFFLN